MGVAFYQYRFFLQVSAEVMLACTRVTSQDDQIVIERNHVFGQKTLDDIIPGSSPPGSGVWLFTRKSNSLDTEVNGRFVGFSWIGKQWNPLRLWHGSSEYAMETIRLDQIRYSGTQDVAADKLPRRLAEALLK